MDLDTYFNRPNNSIVGFPIMPSYRTSWTTGLSKEVVDLNPVQNLGYQNMYENISINNPSALGGHFFSKKKLKKNTHKKKSKSKKSKKKNSKQKSKKSKFGIVRQLTPGGVTTETSWGFLNPL